MSVERCSFRGPHVHEGEHNDAVVALIAAALAEPLGQHGQQAGGTLFLFGRAKFKICLYRKACRWHNEGVKLGCLQDCAEAFAQLCGGVEAFSGLLLEAVQNRAFELPRCVGSEFADRGRLGKLDGAYGLEVRRIGPVKGMPSREQLVEHHAQRENIALYIALPGDELFGSHIRDGAATCGVGAA